MQIEEERVEGIVLQSRAYKENQRLITLFTPQGVLGVLLKGLQTAKGYRGALAEPFSYGEYQLQKGRSELYSCKEGAVLSGYIGLRQELRFLQTAGSLAEAILKSQWPGKEAPALFSLYKAYHDYIEKHSNRKAFMTSFYLKILRLEGVLSPCLEEERWKKEELAVLQQLIDATQFSFLERVEVPEDLAEKVRELFLELVHYSK